MTHPLPDFAADDFVGYIAFKTISQCSMGIDETGQSVMACGVNGLYFNGRACGSMGFAASGFAMDKMRLKRSPVCWMKVHFQGSTLLWRS